MTRVKLKKRLGKSLMASAWFQAAASWLAATAMRLIHSSNRATSGSIDVNQLEALQGPAIIALWHGQHIMAPCFRPNQPHYMALLSRSKDAEINARIVERFGIGTVRGSGGRAEGQRTDKGGASAFLRLKKALQEGLGVVMIADISKAEPRFAGRGIVALARASGCPIVPMACAYSRRKVLEKTWDKTTIPLPFGHYAVVAGAPIFIDSKADEAALETMRHVVTEALNQATATAYKQVDETL